jgi:phospho-N-acetylmuramoyl-pentapeptide-transferase
LVGGLALIGGSNDLAELRWQAESLTLTATRIGQLTVVLPLVWLLYLAHGATPNAHHLTIPLLGDWQLGGWFVLWGALATVVSSNMVGWCDRLDGFVAGSGVVACITLAILAYWVSDHQWCATLELVHFPEARELAVIAAGLAGLLLGFLRFNHAPARLLLGQVGALPIGGLCGFIAVALRLEWAWFLSAAAFALVAICRLTQIDLFGGVLRDRSSSRDGTVVNEYTWRLSRDVSRLWWLTVAMSIFAITAARADSWEGPAQQLEQAISRALRSTFR